MNAVSFTREFDACVGHAKEARGTQFYRGKQIQTFEENGKWTFVIDGKDSEKVFGQPPQKTFRDSHEQAKDLVDEMLAR